LKKRALVWQLYPSYLLVVALSIMLLGWYFIHNFRSFQEQRTIAELERSARLLGNELLDSETKLESPEADRICDQFGSSTGFRYTLILPDGTVTADSESDADMMVNHSDRLEVRKAFADGVGASSRFSETRGVNQFYVAVAMRRDGDLLGIVRASLLMERLDIALSQMRNRLIVFSLLLMLLASGATILATRQISLSLSQISRHSILIGNGDLSRKMPSSRIREIDDVAGSINSMADRLNDRIEKVEQQRDEQNVLFACMVEGVLAVDNDKRVIRMNAAARRLFQFKQDDPRGRMVSEVVRQTDLLDLIDRTLASTEIIEEDIELETRRVYLQAHGSILMGGNGEKIGALVVLNDVSSLHRLEVMRKDFVANVSHELKTPITSIRGFLDTIIETPDARPEDRERFMQIVSQQVDRLQSIVNDLLTFSNLEHEIEKGAVDLHNTGLCGIIRNSIQICSEKARSRKIELLAGKDLDLQAPVNSQLLEQALINLIDNAIKYSNEGTRVEISAKKTDDEIVLSVKDEGIGIPEIHRPRIFERFYCVDKSRSREMGGTGLGLAIVKHVAIAHQGHVEVESEAGKGSTFSIHIPG